MTNITINCFNIIKVRYQLQTISVASPKLLQNPPKVTNDTSSSHTYRAHAAPQNDK